MNLLPVVIALVVVVSGVIVVDHFKGPLFPDVLYSLNDGGGADYEDAHREGTTIAVC
jgi:hypothetical protein